MSGNCVKCRKNISKGRSPGVKCGTCEKIFHVKCAEISEEMLNGLKNGSATWLCPDCRTSENCSLIGGADDVVIQLSSDNPSLSEVVQILKHMENQLEAFKSSLSFLCDSMDEMKETGTYLSKENQFLKEQLTTFERKFEVQEFKINLMEAEFDLAQQKLNKTNIIIAGLPSEKNNSICKLFDKIGVKPAAEDIISVKQMSHNNNTRSPLKNSFIVTLKNIELKNQILTNFRKHKSLNLKEVFGDESGDGRVIIMHHLSKFQSKLYKEAKNIKNKYKFQFLWCKDNKIYLRKSSEANVHLISSFNDINRIWNSNASNNTPTSPVQNNLQDDHPERADLE